MKAAIRIGYAKIRKDGGVARRRRSGFWFLLKQRSAAGVKPGPPGASLLVGRAGLDNIGEDFRRFDQPRSRPVEEVMPVGDKDAAVLYSLESLPSRLRGQRR